MEFHSGTNDDVILELSSTTKVEEPKISPKSEEPTPEQMKSTVTKQISPRKQMAQGISPQEVVCNEGLELIIKYEGTSACVKTNTATKLIERGWSAG